MPAKSKKAPARRRKASTRKPTADTIPGRQPRACRPDVPASYRFPSSPKGLLDWSWARDRLRDSHNYVIVTVRPDGRPHAMGMHGLWFDDAYYFGTHPATRKAKNLAQNQQCIVIAENMEELLIVEGVAEPLAWDLLPDGLSAASKAKYGWPLDPRMGGQVFRVAPRVVFAFPEKQIATAVTKWVFETEKNSRKP